MMVAILLFREPEDNTQNSLILLNFPEYSRSSQRGPAVHCSSDRNPLPVRD